MLLARIVLLVLLLAPHAPAQASLDANGNRPLQGLLDYAVGRRHTCAVTEDGAAWCWGGSPDGQVGDGGFDDRFSPVPVSGLETGVAGIAAGDRSSCALMTDGTVRCWGSNLSYALGLGDAATSFITATPTAVPGLTNGRLIRAAGLGRNACLVDTADQVTCWGSAFFQPPPTVLRPINDEGTLARLGNVRDLGVGSTGACALLFDGTVKCWGSNVGGELGVDPTLVASRNAASTVPGLGAAAVVAIAVGDGHRCAALASGPVRCWGRNTDAQLGRGGTSAFEFMPADVVGLPSSGQAVSLAAGQRSSCAGWSDGRIFCWGENGLGEFGNGSIEPSDTAVPGAAGRSDLVGLKLAMQHACALDAEGALLCWGRADNGQLGTTATPDVLLPQRLAGELAIDVAVGSQTSCSLDRAGQVRCWGQGLVLANEGALQRTPAALADAPISQVDIDQQGGSLACSRNAAGEVRCWGFVWDAARSPSDPPIALSAPALSISVGISHACALLQTGTIECFGDNGSQQLGNVAAGSGSAAPVAVQGLPATPIAVSAGASHSCALLQDGRVACWGSNASRQLGVGGISPAQTATPQLQAAFNDVVEVGAASSHTCARRSDGSIWCWGAGNQTLATLGNDNTADFTAVPTQVAGLPGPAQALTVSAYGGCALVDGEGWCWGWNLHGPIGDGSSRIRHRATRVLLPGVRLVQIAQSNLHTCARSEEDALFCWGWNITGQVGNGDASFATAPERVLVDVLARDVSDVSDAGPEGAGEEEFDGEVSGNGEFVVYTARSPAATKGGPAGPQRLLRRNLRTGEVSAVSVDGAGDPIGGDAMEASVSADGQLVVFVAPRLEGKSAALRGSWPKAGKASGFGVYLRNMLTGSTTAVANAASAGSGTRPRISASGNAIVFGREAEADEGMPGMMNIFRVPLVPAGGGELDVGPSSCQSCTAVSASGGSTGMTSDGPSSDPVLSADGKWLAFQTSSSNYLAGGQPCPATSSTVILRNMLTGASRAVSAPGPGGRCGSGGASKPSMDYAGRNLVFVSSQPLLAEDNNAGSDVYLFGEDGQLRQLSRRGQGSASAEVSAPRISGDGRTVVFTSGATNLDPREPDNNDSSDLYVADLRRAVLQRLSKNRSGTQLDSASRTPSLPYTGRFIAFDSSSGNASGSSTPQQSSVYLRSNALSADYLFEAGFE